ncbi:hypothetical protein IAR50_006653 [Cryptococcus sp. DSM 104548]
MDASSSSSRQSLNSPASFASTMRQVLSAQGRHEYTRSKLECTNRGKVSYQQERDQRRALRSVIETEISKTRDEIDRVRRGGPGRSDEAQGDEAYSPAFMENAFKKDSEGRTSLVVTQEWAERATQYMPSSPSILPFTEPPRAPRDPLARLLTSSDRNKITESLLSEADEDLNAIWEESEKELGVLSAKSQELTKMWIELKALKDGDASV